VEEAGLKPNCSVAEVELGLAYVWKVVAASVALVIAVLVGRLAAEVVG
jgi:hypothetical protein